MKIESSVLSILPYLLAATNVSAQTALRGGAERELQSFQVTTLQLINTNTGAVITNLQMNDSVDISSVGSGVSINAVVSGPNESVKFAYGGNANFRTENFPPYAMCGDNSSKYVPCSVLSAGTHTVTATPFSGTGGSGTSGIPKTVTFSLVTGSTPTPPVPAPAPVPVPMPVPAPVPAPVTPPKPAPVALPPGPSSCKVPKVRNGH